MNAFYVNRIEGKVPSKLEVLEFLEVLEKRFFMLYKSRSEDNKESNEEDKDKDKGEGESKEEGE